MVLPDGSFAGALIKENTRRVVGGCRWWVSLVLPDGSLAGVLIKESTWRVVGGCRWWVSVVLPDGFFLLCLDVRQKDKRKIIYNNVESKYIYNTIR